MQARDGSTSPITESFEVIFIKSSQFDCKKVSANVSGCMNYAADVLEAGRVGIGVPLGSSGRVYVGVSSPSLFYYLRPRQISNYGRRVLTPEALPPQTRSSV